MKAIVYNKYGDPSVLSEMQVDDVITGPSEIKIKVNASSVTAGDRAVRSLDTPKLFKLPARVMLGFFKPKRKILGFEFAGEVVELGEDVERFELGDKVFGSDLESFGGYGEFKCIKETDSVHIMPENLTYMEAAVLPVGAMTALHYLRKSGLKEGDSILVYGGSGSVGTYTIQMAKILGAKVTSVTSDKNFDLMKEIGADQTYDYKSWNLGDLSDQYDMLFDTVNRLDINDAIGMIISGGVYMNCAMVVPSLTLSFASKKKCVSCIVSESAEKGYEKLEEIKHWVELGKLYPIIDQEFKRSHIKQAHEYVDTKRKFGKVPISNL